MRFAAAYRGWGLGHAKGSARLGRGAHPRTIGTPGPMLGARCSAERRRFYAPEIREKPGGTERKRERKNIRMVLEAPRVRRTDRLHRAYSRFLLARPSTDGRKAPHCTHARIFFSRRPGGVESGVTRAWRRRMRCTDERTNCVS
ncbi:hypothetical protein GY45DRAFT_1104406 [Cubamyces sp. BRFM 1775]|nr:hypothetical protein GY45DRAFT_1104406 [Cubamyces sp. BRFM 1775]